MLLSPGAEAGSDGGVTADAGVGPDGGATSRPDADRADAGKLSADVAVPEAGSPPDADTQRGVVRIWVHGEFETRAEVHAGDDVAIFALGHRFSAEADRALTLDLRTARPCGLRALPAETTPTTSEQIHLAVRPGNESEWEVVSQEVGGECDVVATADALLDEFDFAVNIWCAPIYATELPTSEGVRVIVSGRSGFEFTVVRQEVPVVERLPDGREGEPQGARYVSRPPAIPADPEPERAVAAASSALVHLLYRFDDVLLRPSTEWSEAPLRARNLERVYRLEPRDGDWVEVEDPSSLEPAPGDPPLRIGE